MFRQPPGRERWIAIAIELLPLLGTAMYLRLAGYESPLWHASVLSVIFFVTFFATGFGWSMLGRWDIGIAAAFVRIGGTIAAMMLFLVTVQPCILECRGQPDLNPVLTAIFGTILAVAYFGTTLGSPLALIWALRRESGLQDGGT